MKQFWKVFAVTTVFYLIVALLLPLTDQEAYYWLWSKHPAFCYFDHPPLQAIFTHLFEKVFGDNNFSVRFPLLIARIVGLRYFYLWCRLRLDESASAFALLVLISSFFFMAIAMIALPDGFMFPFAMMTLYYADRQKPWATGFSLGLAALAKWSTAVYIPGVTLAFVYPAHGKWRVKNWLNLFIAGSVSFALQAPVLYWNYIHNWPSFRFHLETRHKSWSEISPSFALQNFLNFSFSQFILGLFGVTLLVFWARKNRAEVKSGPLSPPLSPLSSPLWAWIAPAFIVFGYSAIKGESRFYWTSIAFFPLIVWLILRMKPSAQRLQGYSKWLVGLTYLSCLLLYLILFFPVGAYVKPLTDHYRKYDLRFSPRGDIDGWEEWIQNLENSEHIPVDKVAFIGSDIRLAAQAAWALRDRGFERATTASPFQNEFLFWPHPRPEQYSNAIFFFDNRYNFSPVFTGFCMRAPKWQVYQVKLYGEVIKEIHWGLCEGYVWHNAITQDWL